jgi:hypothetical protein
MRTQGNIPRGFILRQTLRGPSALITRMAWSPDGQALASSSLALVDAIQLWDAQTGQHVRTLGGHFGYIYSVIWSQDGRTLVTCSQDQTIRLWDPNTGERKGILNHTGGVINASFSNDGRLLASKADAVRIWRVDTWELIATLEEPASGYWDPSLTFHPKAPILATLGENDTVIRIWDLDVPTLLGTASVTLALPGLSVVDSVLRDKIAKSDFDVFLCHNGKDKPEVKKIGEQLKKHGILPWLDEWELRPGIPWQPLLEQQIEKVKSAAVFIGKSGIGPWEDVELQAFLREFVKRGCPVIPVLLPDAPREPQLPLFLRGITWVDFRKQEPDPMEQLIWGITGKRGSG